jgi:hypothetical protein
MIKTRCHHVTYVLDSLCKGTIARGFAAISIMEAVGKAKAYARFTRIPRLTVTVMDSCGLVVHQEQVVWNDRNN